MGDQTNYASAINGVDPATLRSLNMLVGTAGYQDVQIRALSAELQERLESLRAEYQPALEAAGLTQEEAHRRIKDLFFHGVMEVAESTDDIKTVQLPNGRLEWRRASSETITITNEAAFLAWAGENGVLRRVSVWRRVILKERIEQLLVDRPELRRTIEGVEITRSHTLAIRTDDHRIPIFKAANVQETVL